MLGLGIDGGGTKTVCVLMDDRGEVLGRGEAGPCNYQTVGLEAAGNAIKRAMIQAVGKKAGDITVGGLGLGLAGVGRPEDVETVRKLLGQIQSDPDLWVNWDVKPENFAIGGDNAIALVGGLGHDVGIVAIAGTGSQIFGRNSQGKTKRVGGWGYVLGDEGGGYDIAVRGLRAVMRSFDGRLPPTALTEAFLSHFDLESPEGLIEVIYRRDLAVKEIAALSPIVDRAAAAGDSVSVQIIAEISEELIGATKVAIAELFDPAEALEIVTMGGVWRGMADLRRRFITGISAIAPEADVLWPRHEPAYGAALLALNLGSGSSH